MSLIRRMWGDRCLKAKTDVSGKYSGSPTQTRQMPSAISCLWLEPQKTHTAHTHISDALAVLHNTLVDGEISLRGEECVSVCVYKFLYMQHPWQQVAPDRFLLMRDVKVPAKKSLSWSRVCFSYSVSVSSSSGWMWFSFYCTSPEYDYSQYKGPKSSDCKSILNVYNSINQQAIS